MRSAANDRMPAPDTLNIGWQFGNCSRHLQFVHVCFVQAASDFLQSVHGIVVVFAGQKAHGDNELYWGKRRIFPYQSRSPLISQRHPKYPFANGFLAFFHSVDPFLYLLPQGSTSGHSPSHSQCKLQHNIFQKVAYVS